MCSGEHYRPALSWPPRWCRGVGNIGKLVELPATFSPPPGIRAPSRYGQRTRRFLNGSLEIDSAAAGFDPIREYYSVNM